MKISKRLDYFKTKVYNHSEVIILEKFMDFNFDIKDINIACYVSPREGDSVHKNRPNHGLALHLDGNKKYVFDTGKVLTVKKGDIIYLPKNSNYNVYVEGSGECYAINFNISEENSFEPFVLETKNTGLFLDCFKSAEKAWSQKHIQFEFKCKSELYDILYNMKQEISFEYFPKSKIELIKPAIDYIHNNYTSENLSISHLSSMCNMTPEYFRRIFNNFYGTSPAKYINNLKITLARELLQSELYSVSAVCEMSGFSDLSHFSRVFKKLTGFSPSQYTKNLK